MAEFVSEIARLNERSRAILRQIVESYLVTGEPVGSRNLSRALPMTLSPASIRNVMSDLEHAGLIYAPHTSAGRLPTQTGLRLFVDGLLEVGHLSEDERRQIEAQIRVSRAHSLDQVLSEASEMISGLSHCAGLVLAEKQVSRLKHIEFVPLDPGRPSSCSSARTATSRTASSPCPGGLPPSALVEASNFLNSAIRGLTITEARSAIEKQLASAKAELDELTQKVIKSGLAEWSGSLDDRKSLIVRGQSNLLKDVSAMDDLERIRQLFDDLESKRDLVQILGPVGTGRRRAHFHRVGEQTVLDVGLVPRCRPIPGREPQGCRRSGHHRPDPHELRPHHPYGRLHRQADRSLADLIFVARG